MSPRCLVTGFEPFDGDALNPSWLIAQSLHGLDLGGVRVQAEQLPCAFDQAGPALQAALRRHRPRLVLALGQAARGAIGMERVALNVIDARIADNAGLQPIDVPVLAAAPPAYFSTLPLKAMTAALKAEGLAAEVSNSAGTFVCNQVFFLLMHALRRRAGVRGGFVHVPGGPRPGRGHAAARDAARRAAGPAGRAAARQRPAPRRRAPGLISRAACRRLRRRPSRRPWPGA
jgi:pyroglutamyl-peptidase